MMAEPTRQTERKKKALAVITTWDMMEGSWCIIEIIEGNNQVLYRCPFKNPQEAAEREKQIAEAYDYDLTIITENGQI
jgi:hypothetical protein